MSRLRTPPGTAPVLTRSPAETRRFAASLVPALPDSAVLALHGELGSGKTCFVQGLADALGIDRVITSPTFTIVNEYGEGRKPLIHIDLYRIGGPDEALALGFEEYLYADGITVVEWAERAADLFPTHSLHIRFESLERPSHRRITLHQTRNPADLLYSPRLFHNDTERQTV